MNQTTPVEEKNSFLRNDRLLVCSMLAFYGICILALLVATVWGLDYRSKTISANTTSTALAEATQHANATATAVARRVEQAKYQFTERFDNNRKDWFVGSEDDEYWSGYVAIQDGVYLWNAKQAKQGFVYWADFYASNTYHDFDVYVDTKVGKGASGHVCSGLIFRETYDESSKANNYYYYVLCNNSMVDISYHSGEDDWENIASVPYSFSPDEWNRMEISARGSHFILSIDGNVVYEMEDDRQKTGAVALVIEVADKGSARLYFDNFGYQPR